jgi:hypothetical protein
MTAPAPLREMSDASAASTSAVTSPTQEDR